MKKSLLVLIFASMLCLTACGMVDGPGMENTDPAITSVSEETSEFSSAAATEQTTAETTRETTTNAIETSESTTKSTTVTSADTKATEVTTEESEPAPVETPVTILERICSERDEISLSYYSLDNGKSKQIVVKSEVFLSRCNQFLDSFEWTEEPVLSDTYIAPELYYIFISGWGPTNDFLRFSSVLGATYVQHMDYSNSEVVLYDASNEPTGDVILRRWSCSDNAVDGTFVEMLRRVYFDLEFAETEFTVFGSYDPSMICESFVRKDYFDARNRLSSGNHYRFKDYSLISFEIYEVNEDNTAFTAGFRYAYVPEDWESPYIWAGNAVLGTGVYEGMIIESRSFAMKLGDDIYWYCTDIGTGRASLPN